MRTSWTLWRHWGIWGPFQDHLSTWGHEDFDDLFSEDLLMIETLLAVWGSDLRTEFFEDFKDLLRIWGLRGPFEDIDDFDDLWGLFKELSTLGTFWRLSEHLEDFEALLRTFWVTFEDFLRIFSGPFLELWTWEPVDFELFLRTF